MTGGLYHFFRKRQFLLTCLLRGMTEIVKKLKAGLKVSTHMPLARHDIWYTTKPPLDR